jgi:RimJ/RimL family protein N-acetyltransferase
LPPGWYGHDGTCQDVTVEVAAPVSLDRLMSWHNPLVRHAPDFSVKPTITGEKVVLRPFTADDLPGMLQVLRDPEALKLTGTVHHDAEAAGLAEEKSFHDWYASRNDQPDRLDLAVIDGARGGCVGEAVLNERDPGNHSCSFRITLGPAGRGGGLGTEATRLIVGYGFERLGMHRISLEVYSFNPRARRVYEKAGFRAEGVLRESLRYGGEWIDATVMSILSSEWAEHHGHPSHSTRLGQTSSMRHLSIDDDGGCAHPHLCCWVGYPSGRFLIRLSVNALRRLAAR